MSEYFDSLETRDPAEREAALMAALPGQIAHAQTHGAAMARILAGVQAQDITSREALATLPVTRKSELLALQKAARSAGGDTFGGFAAIRTGLRMPRVYASPVAQMGANFVLVLAPVGLPGLDPLALSQLQHPKTSKPARDARSKAKSPSLSPSPAGGA